MFDLVALLPHLAGLSLEKVVLDLDGEGRPTTLFLVATQPTAPCPCCGNESSRVHQRYWRTVADLPCGGRTLILRLHVRRFRCTNPHCPRLTFADRLPKLAGSRARRSHGHRAALEDIGFALGGSAGARLARRRGLPASRSTILRLVHVATQTPAQTPRVLGVDDWARRRGQTYGTILVDLERHRPVDLLEDRTAEAFENWLREHPGVEVIARDRAGAYADGAKKGAPKAIQVADRFHLLVNVGDALERVLSRKHTVLKNAAAAVDCLAVGANQAVPMTSPLPSLPLTSGRPTRKEQLGEARRARRLARYEAVVALYEQGFTQRAIGRQLGIGRRTVRRFLKAGSFPERAQPARRPTMLTPYEPYLRERWTAACHNAHTLWEEIRDRGFAGSASLVRQFVARWRPSPGRRGPTPRRVATGPMSPTLPTCEPTRVLSARQARWLLLRDVSDLKEEEQVYREQLLEADEELPRVKALADEFARIIRSRDRAALGAWLQQAERSGVGELRQFALVLRRDLAAVEAALTYEWSNGQTEGQINRLKFLKRQMYGRASLGLLRRRFLQAA